MKKYILIFSFLLFVNSLYSQILYEETFENYPLGDFTTDPTGVTPGLGNWYVFLDKNTAYKLFFPKNRSKVTEIERYFNCPYQHFLEYGLKLRTPEVSQIDSLTIGTILHAVLENFTKMMINSTLPSADISNIATTIFDQIILAPQYAYLRVSGQNQTILN